MKNLKVEYTAVDFKEKNPDNVFFKELSRQITPKINALITDEHLRDSLNKLISISIDNYWYTSPMFLDGVNYMLLNISALSSPLVICSFGVLWYTEKQERVYPWDDVQNKLLHFDINGEFPSDKLNMLLPELHHPLIKAEKSGLLYDYQIYYGGRALTLYYDRNVSENDIKEVDTVLNAFFNKCNADEGECRFNSFDTKISNKTRIKVSFESELLSADEAESIIFAFRHLNGVKRIVCR